MAIIYGLVDPRDGEVKYVGRTKQKLETRLSQHIDNARRGKFLHHRAWWVRGVLSAGRKPLITHLETVDDAAQVQAEARWMGRFSGLVNSGTASQGGTRSYVARWTPELEAMLGVVADSVVAEKVGVTRKAVTYRRKVLGIPASNNRARNKPPPNMAGHNKVEIPDWAIDLLGSMPDYELAAKCGVSKRTINRERRKRKIASYAQSTGNDGKFHTGCFPIRWLKYGSETRTETGGSLQ